MPILIDRFGFFFHFAAASIFAFHLSAFDVAGVGFDGGSAAAVV